MDKDYTRTKTTVSMINYHFVFCPRYRRKIFDFPRVEERFKDLVFQQCSNLGITVLAMECHHDHAHLFLRCLPKQSPAGIMSRKKGATSRALRSEFEQLSRARNFWTRSYFVSTAGDVSSETIRKYVETQKTRP